MNRLNEHYRGYILPCYSDFVKTGFIKAKIGGEIFFLSSDY